MQKSNGMKMYGIAIAVAFAFLLTTASSQSIGGVNNVLSLSSLIVSPSPVVAGSNVTITFMLFNSYSDSLSNVNINLQANNQIINVSPSSSYLISSIGSGIYGGLGYNVFRYKFHIPSTLSSGLYTINVVANYEAPYTSSINLPGTSIMPITFYIYGVPKISFNIVPQNQLIPGGTFNFQLVAVNTGTDTATNVSASLVSSKEFNLSGQTSFNLGTIAPGSSVQSYASAIVASNISSGVHNVSIQVNYRTAAKNYNYTSIVPLSIATGNPNIVVNIGSAMPQQLYSGSNQTISAVIQNTGSGAAKNLTVAFTSNKYITVQSSASTFFIGTLNPGASVTESIFISANSSISTSRTTMPVNISYYNSNLQGRSNVIEQLPINIAPSAIFQIVSVNDSLHSGSAYSPIVLRVKNIGNQAAKDVSVSLQSIYPITPVAGNAYITYLAPGNETDVTFYVNIDQNGLQGQYLLTIYEQWRQSNSGVNQQFSSSNNYYASVYPSGQGSSNTGTYAGIAIVIIIVFVAAIVMRLRGKGKKEKAKK